MVDVGKVAVRQADLPDHSTERAGEQPPEDFPFDQWREHRGVGGVVEQSQHPGDRVGQLGVVPDVSMPVTPLALVVPATILLANVISIGPAVTAMRTHPASVLREE